MALIHRDNSLKAIAISSGSYLPFPFFFANPYLPFQNCLFHVCHWVTIPNPYMSSASVFHFFTVIFLCNYIFFKN
jgi:hypothetical protein